MHLYYLKNIKINTKMLNFIPFNKGFSPLFIIYLTENQCLAVQLGKKKLSNKLVKTVF